MRIIPALAGNTIGCLCNVQPAKDHPRSRGEYVPVSEECGLGLGSSPLSRGIPLRPPPRAGGAGIIPALAGNTGLRHDDPRSRTDHPRSRGEYVSPALDALRDVGSSPLSRGIHPLISNVAGITRIIPALAGNTDVQDSAASPHWDHPRSRGEYGDVLDLPRRTPGSSPLSRGIPRSVLLVWLVVGIIPALAGNTVGADSPRASGADHPRSRGEYWT